MSKETAESDSAATTCYSEDIGLDNGIWTLEILTDGDTRICDPSGRRVHRSNGHQSTAVHLVMALQELRQAKKAHTILYESIGNSGSE